LFRIFGVRILEQESSFILLELSTERYYRSLARRLSIEPGQFRFPELEIEVFMPTQKDVKSEILAKYSPLQKSIRLNLYLYRQSARRKTEGVLWAGTRYRTVSERHFDHLWQIPGMVYEMLGEIGVKHDVSPHPHSDNLLMDANIRRNAEFYEDVAKFAFKPKTTLRLTQDEKAALLQHLLPEQGEHGEIMDSVVQKLTDITTPEECPLEEDPEGTPQPQ